MVYFVRSSKFIRSRGQEAIEWALKVADYISSKYDIELEVLMNVTGPQNELHWMSHNGSVGAFEEGFLKLTSDQEYQNMLGDSVGLFVDGSSRDHYYRSASEMRIV